MLPLTRTKIIATLGPASSDLNNLKKLILAGVNVVRLNFSHGQAQEHIAQAHSIRQASAELNAQVALLADLQGPKIRIGCFKQGKVTLQTDQVFILDADLADNQGDVHQVSIDYKALPKDVCSGDILLLDDGRVALYVTHVDGNKIICRVTIGGPLSDHKGINKQGGGLSAAPLTEKDQHDLKTAVALDADYIAVSFPRCADDMIQVRSRLHHAHSQAGLIAKIERAEAMDTLDEIIQASDAVMVARGDLGIEIGDAELPAAQKKIIQRARALDRAVITATQMMESMIYQSLPTRAEVFDVANAILDGTDAVMLSAETAIGRYPVKVIEAVNRVCQGAEKHRSTRISGHRMDCFFQRIDEAIAMATMYTANHLNIKAIIALTESGHTPLLMSRLRSGIPIYALSPNLKTLRKVCLYRGIYPIEFKASHDSSIPMNEQAIATLIEHGAVGQGDQVIITKGDLTGVQGSTNSMKILTVP